MINLSRRDFARAMLATSAGAIVPGLRAQSCAPPAGVAQAFAFIPLANVQRKAITVLHAAETTRLRLAYTRLRNLTTSNPALTFISTNASCASC